MWKSNYTLVLAFALLLALAAPAPSLAQATQNNMKDTNKTPVTLDKVVVSARGSATSLSMTPGGVGVVDEQEILLEPHNSVADALARLPGISRTGDSPWGQDINIRGLTGASVVVLIDGMRVNTPTDINARLGFINPMDIERVEVLKGPISALYGSGSIGGVINIITKHGHFSDDWEATGEGIGEWVSNPEGPNGYVRGGVNGKNIWMQLSGALREHDDYYAGDSERVDNSSYNDQYFRFAAGFRPSDEFRTEIQIMNMEATNVGIPGGSSTMPQTAPVDYPRSSNLMLSMNSIYTPNSDVVKEVLLNLYFMQNDRRVEISNPAPIMKSINPSANHETLGGKLQAQFEFGAHSLLAGVDAWNWNMNSKRTKYLLNGRAIDDQPTPNTTQTSMGVFAEDDWSLTEELTLNLGGRLDRIEIDNKEYGIYEAGTHEDLGWNAHAGLTWQAAPAWSHTLLAASSYRAADIMERFKDLQLGGGVTALGNPDLDPEQSYYLEYGLHYTTETVRATASAYANFITDYISSSLVSPTLLQMENIGEAHIYGAELEADWSITPHWNLYGNLALCVGRDEEKDEPLRNIAPVNGLMGLKYAMGNGFWARLETPWAAQQDEVPDGIAKTDGWMTMNMAAGYDFDWEKLHHQIALVANNILDERYHNYLANSRGVELMEPGFNLALTYRISF
ncbi:MAG: TonB-dependent receptor [Desulfovibrio sp.]|uniref:TonB-dependent receptor n=1 Tax=Desulfovibrio sp. 7SRBS1 TaxID=3378064 RepID=UPI003B3EF565